MTTAILLSKRPLVRFDDEGRRVLREDLKIDLGQRVAALHIWDSLRQTREGGPRRVTQSRRGNTIITVRAGLVYDGASLPAGLLVRLLAGPKERYEVAAAFHDALYLWGAPRDGSDLAFWIISRSGPKQVNRARGWAAWAGLRLGGWWAYWQHRRRQKGQEVPPFVPSRRRRRP